MPVAITEVLNNLVSNPEILRALNSIVPQVRKIQITPVAVSANTTAEQTFTVTGVSVGDFVYAIKPATQAGLGLVNTRVTASNTIGITFVNCTAGSLTPTASETYLVLHAPALASPLVNAIP